VWETSRLKVHIIVLTLAVGKLSGISQYFSSAFPYALQQRRLKSTHQHMGKVFLVRPRGMASSLIDHTQHPRVDEHDTRLRMTSVKSNQQLHVDDATDTL
jgi:hypothetical protein